MGFLNKVFGVRGAPTNPDARSSRRETCPSCRTVMVSDGLFVAEWFECPGCGKRFFREANGVLTPYTRRSDRTCINCQQSLEGSELTAEWEDGDNAYAYITCRHCGAENPF